MERREIRLHPDDVRAIASGVADRLQRGTAPDRPRLLTFPEAAARLGCHTNTVRNLAEAGHLVITYVTPRAPRISEAQVDLFVRSRTGRY